MNDIREILYDNDIDILAISETWLHAAVLSSTLHIERYTIIRRDYDSRGSGVALYISDRLKYKVVDTEGEVEHICVKVTNGFSTQIYCVIYRRHALDCNLFFENLTGIVEKCLMEIDDVIILGDMNINIYNDSSRHTSLYLDTIGELGLSQLISEPTRGSSLLDHILVSNEDRVIESGVIFSDVSDHDIIFAIISVTKQQIVTEYVTHRDFRHFDRTAFTTDLINLHLDLIVYTPDIDSKVSILTNAITVLFEKHAPLKTSRITKSPMPWITHNIRSLMKIRDKAKLKYKNTKNSSDYEHYKQMRNFTTKSLSLEKRAYFQNKFKDNDSKVIYKELHNLNIVKSKATKIPRNIATPNELNDYFTSVPAGDSTDDTDVLALYPSFVRQNIDAQFDFTTVSDETIVQLLAGVKSRAAGHDGINIDMVKMCCPHIIPYLVNIINSCILENYFPKAWKEGIVTPLPKTGEVSDLSHLRAISVLPVLSKILEKIMARQLGEHVGRYDILPEAQSGFRPGYSCTTALLSVTDDIHTAVDNKLITVLVLLDFTRAFDTVSHETLLAILKHINLAPGALAMMSTYLSGRSQRVRLHGELSDSRLLSSGVPQGSILGPHLFALYVHALPGHLQYCKYHMYADDIQLYYSFKIDEIDGATERINKDLNTICDVSRLHSLLLNPLKCKAILFGGEPWCGLVERGMQLRVGNVMIPFVKEVKNLGLVMDNTFRYRQHVSSSLRRAYGALRLLYPHRGCLPLKLKLSLCNSLVLSQVKYCSEVYFESLDYNYKNKIQMLQNSCIRFAYGIRKYEHISEKLLQSGWFIMKKAFRLRELCLFHSVIKSKKPPYLYNRITFRTDIRNINVRRKDTIVPPRHRTSSYERSFTYRVYKHYSILPYEIRHLEDRSFRHKLRSFITDV